MLTDNKLVPAGALVALLMWGAGCESEQEPVCKAAGLTDCGGSCINTDFDPRHCGACNNACYSGEVCTEGACAMTCTGGTKKCEEKCVDIKVDEKNCGSCGFACKTGEVCSAGSCAMTCTGGTKKCGTTCVDTTFHAKHCGKCDKACKTGEVCSAGSCGMTCVGGSTKCGEKCTNTDNDPKHCGTCNTACTGGKVCAVGKCALACAPGQTQCGIRCVDTGIDPQNCGKCGTSCLGGEVCVSGKCSFACVGGTTKCGSKCADLKLDPLHCGKCGNACKSGEVCSASKCGTSCSGGTTLCGTMCVNTSLDAKNCGTCSNVCKSGEVCSAGKCSLTCGGGSTQCSGKCVDTAVDPANCGSCGNSCPGASICSGGKCSASCSGGSKLCGGKCVDTTTDSQNCGACGKQCPGTCKAGTCCGDGKLDAGEDCDGQALNNKTCQLLGMKGTLACSAKCSFDTSSCTWATWAGGTDDDAVYGIAADAKGNLYVSGYFQGTGWFGSTTLSSKGAKDAFVAKLDAKGKFLWAVGAGGTGNDHALDVATDSQGNSYVVGEFEQSASFGTQTIKSSGFNDIFVAKLDPTGKFLWVVRAGGINFDGGSAVALDASGNAYVAGRFAYSADFGTTTLSASIQAGYVAKISSGGSFLWAAQTNNSNAHAEFRDLTVGPAGNAITTGSFKGNATVGSATFYATNGLLVAKLDATGKWAWAVSTKGSASSVDGVSVAVDSKGNSYVRGKYSGTPTFGSATLVATRDMFLAKLDSTGKWLWADASATQTSTLVIGGKLAVDGQDNLLMTDNCTSGQVIGGTTCTDANSLFTAKLDSTGKYIWVAKAPGTKAYGNSMGIVVDHQGRPHVAGSFSGSGVFGGTTLASKDKWDSFVWAVGKSGK